MINGKRLRTACDAGISRSRFGVARCPRSRPWHVPTVSTPDFKVVCSMGIVCNPNGICAGTCHDVSVSSACNCSIRQTLSSVDCLRPAPPADELVTTLIWKERAALRFAIAPTELFPRGLQRGCSNSQTAASARCIPMQTCFALECYQ